MAVQISRQFSYGNLTDRPGQFESGHMINKGSFADIYLMRSRINQEVFALKVASCDQISDRQVDQFTGELLMLRQLHHRNIIKPCTSWTDGSQFVILLPLMTYRSCADVAKKNFPTGINEYAMGQILSHILPAIDYMHEKKIVHRCVKGSHILINQHGVAVLSGLKFAISKREDSKQIFKTNLIDMAKCLNWLSPEIMAQDSTGYSFNSDVYSLGITILELCNGEVPFNEISPAAMLVQKLKFSPPKLWDINQLPSSENASCQPSTSIQALHDEIQDEDMIATHDQTSERDRVYARKCYSKDFRCFTSMCLINDQIYRPNVAQLKKHRFYKGFTNSVDNTLINSLRLNDGLRFYTTVAGGDRVGQHEQVPAAHFEWNFE